MLDMLKWKLEQFFKRTLPFTSHFRVCRTCMHGGSQLACFLALKAAVSHYVEVEYRPKL